MASWRISQIAAAGAAAALHSLTPPLPECFISTRRTGGHLSSKALVTYGNEARSIDGSRCSRARSQALSRRGLAQSVVVDIVRFCVLDDMPTRRQQSLAQMCAAALADGEAGGSPEHVA